MANSKKVPGTQRRRKGRRREAMGKRVPKREVIYCREDRIAASEEGSSSARRSIKGRKKLEVTDQDDKDGADSEGDVGDGFSGAWVNRRGGEVGHGAGSGGVRVRAKEAVA